MIFYVDLPVGNAKNVWEERLSTTQTVGANTENQIKGVNFRSMKDKLEEKKWESWTLIVLIFSWKSDFISSLKSTDQHKQVCSKRGWRRSTVKLSK